MTDTGKLSRQLANLPDLPGVYIMRDSKDRILYIGKAVNLKKRVRSYFRKNPDSVKTLFLAQKISGIEFYTVDTEVEALILEANLVQKEKPPYNIRLKDDKQYASLAITRGPYPRLVVTRNRNDRYPRYFGPYTSGRAVRQTLDFINKNFKLRKCDRGVAPGKTVGKPCLYFQMGQCLAPCQGGVADEAYSAVVQEVVLFLDAEYEKLVPRLEARMRDLSKALDFEAAAGLRDAIEDIRHISQKQNVNLPHADDLDIACYAAKDGVYCLLVAFVRQGRITGRKVYFHSDPLGLPDSEVIGGFVKQYYASADHIPERIVVSTALADAAEVGLWLSGRAGRTVTLEAADSARGGQAPDAGEPPSMRGIVRMLTANAALQLEEHFIEEMARNRRHNLHELKNSLRLKRLPVRIEAFDISNLGADNPVASMVTFNKGVPDKSNYRRYKMKFTRGQNDFAMIEEVVGRRYQRLLNEKKPLPDLVLIDGGPGQLKSAFESVRRLGLKDLPLISLAKKEEQIHTLFSEKPVSLPRDSSALQLLQAIRDEAHRFAITFHKKLRSKKFLPEDTKSD
jgi:excinuclease ABC subunit C